MEHFIKIPVIRWPAAGWFCALTHCVSFTHCDTSPYKYICVGVNVSDCIAHGHWPVSHMLSAGGPVGAQLPCSALGHTWGGESRGLFICLLTCFVSFLVCAVLENRRIAVSLLILFSSGCIHHADREGRHVHMKPRATVAIAIAALSQSPPCCFSLRANIPMNFRAYFRALAQSFPLLCRYSSPLPVWCFKYQWLYLALKLPHEIIESACITINNWRVLIHEALTLSVCCGSLWVLLTELLSFPVLVILDLFGFYLCCGLTTAIADLEYSMRRIACVHCLSLISRDVV